MVEGNQKLAQRAEEVAGDDLPHKEDGALDEKEVRKLGLRKIGDRYFKIKTLIETRGEGGQVLSPLCLPGTHPNGGVYRLISGDLRAIPTITTEEREILLTAARACNEFVDPKDIEGNREASREKVEGVKPGAGFNARADVCEKVRALLEEHGWMKFGKGVVGELWSRPGVNDHCSGTLFSDGTFYVFSTNAAPFDANQAYSPFAIYTELNCGGDYSAAAKALAEQGYGEQRKNLRKKTDKPTSDPGEEATPTNAPAQEEDDDSQDAGKKSGGKDPLSLLLIKLALGNSELFHDAGGDCYASLTVNGHRETHKLGSRDYKDWLAGLLYRLLNEAPSVVI